MARRIRWFGVAMIVCFCGLLIQLDNIQGLKANQYQHAPNNPVTIEAEYAEPRGIIVSSDGVVLATSKPTPSSAYYKYERDYPTGSLFSQIVGFTSFRYGTFTGVESQYNSQLTFKTQPFRSLGDLITTEQGTDTVVLTLSDKLQSLAQRALGSNVGAVVALDPSNGDVLAMYSNPTFDPNPLASPSIAAEDAGWSAYIARGAHGFVNGLPMAFDSGFSPGSTFKVITSAAAYDHGLANVSLPFAPTYQPPGTNLSIHNAEPGPCGGTLQQMLPPSCDTGYAHLGVDLGAANLVNEAASFGFGARPPIDLPTNPSSVSCMTPLTSTPPCMSALSLQANQPFVAYSAIGQEDVLATPLEMAMVASGIADDGVIMKPHVMSRILDPKDNVVQTYQPTQWLRATSAQTAQSVSTLMQAVVSNPPGPYGGTAYGIFPSSWQVAAKTGTAQIQGGTTDWMIAFAPASHPQVAIAVVVPDQALSASGARVSGPIVKAVLAGLPLAGNG